MVLWFETGQKDPNVLPRITTRRTRRKRKENLENNGHRVLVFLLILHKLKIVSL